ncbi:CobW family GTP-binding protein [Yoonia vestfoldensis]|uniref:CobW family GTP-binding protein n=1 Tax=Yoonia vestfoldensis TaxID=245188 RepID=UPI00037A7A9C|nr:GTP-binding protein [Yoonia vestfoldensis]
MTRPIPVTLLTGFLGAGKTTLLNRLLHDPAAGRVAVVVNEFGEAGLDHDLIEGAAEDVVLMPAGCICCTIRGDLSKTLARLLVRRSVGALHFDRVIIETTGLADPGPIHHTLLVDPVLAADYALDGTVTAVDVVLGLSTLDRHAEAQAQVAMADRIVLTKSDLADATTLRALESRLDRLNPGARRIIADKGSVPAGMLFGLSAMRRAITDDQAIDWLAAPAPDPLAGLSGLRLPAQPAINLAAPSHHASDDRITTAAITLDTPIAPEVFDLWLDTLIALRGPDILRLKGIVHIKDLPTPFVFHGVQHIFEPPVPLGHWPAGDGTSRIVVIARDIPLQDLQDSLAMLRLAPENNATTP